MGRLTQYFECGAYVDRSNIVNISELAEQFFEKGAYMGKAIDKLAEFEDLLEELGIESVEELKRILTTNAVWQENQALKDRWEKLKEFIKTEYQTNLKNNEMQGFCMLKLVEAQMQEFEKED